MLPDLARDLGGWKMTQRADLVSLVKSKVRDGATVWRLLQTQPFLVDQQGGSFLLVFYEKCKN